MLSEKVSLAPADEQFRQTQTQAVGSSVSLDIATTAIIEQPTFKHLNDPKLADLVTHQDEAKELANEWREGLRQQIFSVNQSIIDYTRYFNEYYGYMVDFLNIMENAKDKGEFDKSKSNLIATLNQLILELQKQKGTVEQTSAAIKSLQKRMMENESKLKGDYDEICAYYKGEQGKLEDLKNAIDSYNAAMSKDLALIGGGAAGIVVGGLTIAVGVGSIILGGSGAVIIGVGVAIVAGGATCLTIGAVDYSKKSQAKADAIAELSSINSEIAIAQSLTSDVSVLTQNLDLAVSCLDQIDKAWSVLINDYKSVIDALKETDESTSSELVFIIRANLEVSKKAWETLDEDANTFKKNILNPTPVDTSGLNNNTKVQCTPTIPLKVVFAKSDELKVKEQPSQEKQQTSLTVAVEDLVDTTNVFADQLEKLDQRYNVPDYVEKASSQLKPNAGKALNDTVCFVDSNEKLASCSISINQILKIEDNEVFLEQVHYVLAETDNKLQATIEYGNSAQKSIYTLEKSTNETDTQLEAWLDELKKEKQVDESMLRDATNMYRKLKDEESTYKVLIWIPFVNIAAAIKLRQLDDDIRRYQNKIRSTEESLWNVSNIINCTGSLAIMSKSLQTDVDAVLSSLQYISVMLRNIDTSLSVDQIFLIKSKLSVIASQLQDLGVLRLKKTGIRLFRAIKGQDSENSFQNFLESCVTSASRTDISARTCAIQPALQNVENLLKQDAVILKKNATDWITSYSTTVTGVLSSYRSLCRSIKLYSESAINALDRGEIRQAEYLYQTIVSCFVEQAELNYKLRNSLAIFINAIKENDAEFGLIQDIVTKELEPEVNEMILADMAFSAKIDKALNDIINESTRMVGEYLTAELMIAVSVALGQIELGAASASTFITYLKKGINTAIAKGSDKLSEAGIEKFKNIKANENVIDDLVEKRCENLMNISRTKSDISVINVLRGELSSMSKNISTFSELMYDNKETLEAEARDFIYIKSLFDTDREKAKSLIKEKLDNWSNIEKLVNILLLNYINN